jgi:hypothetical protein
VCGAALLQQQHEQQQLRKDVRENLFAVADWTLGLLSRGVIVCVIYIHIIDHKYMYIS